MDFSFVYLTIFLGDEGKESYKKWDKSAPKLQELIKCPDTQGPVTHYRFFHTTYFVKALHNNLHKPKNHVTYLEFYKNISNHHSIVAIHLTSNL